MLAEFTCEHTKWPHNSLQQQHKNCQFTKAEYIFSTKHLAPLRNAYLSMSNEQVLYITEYYNQFLCGVEINIKKTGVIANCGRDNRCNCNFRKTITGVIEVY
jgi:hypothetical protein